MRVTQIEEHMETLTSLDKVAISPKR